MLFFLFLPLFLEPFFLGTIVELAKYWVVIMGFPILLGGSLGFMQLLFLNLFFVVLLVDPIHDVKVFFVSATKQVFTFFHWQLHISLLEVEFRQSLIVDDVVSVPHWS